MTTSIILLVRNKHVSALRTGFIVGIISLVVIRAIIGVLIICVPIVTLSFAVFTAPAGISFVVTAVFACFASAVPATTTYVIAVSAGTASVAAAPAGTGSTAAASIAASAGTGSTAPASIVASAGTASATAASITATIGTTYAAAASTTTASAGTASTTAASAATATAPAGTTSSTAAPAATALAPNFCFNPDFDHVALFLMKCPADFCISGAQ